MPVPPGYARVSLVGTTTNPEIFDTSFWCLGGAGSQAELQSLCDGVAAAIKNGTAFAETLTLIPAESSYDTVRGYAYPNGGSKASWVAEADLGLAGTSGGQSPLQCSIVVSLRTALVGRNNRGRMYLPATGITVTDQHQYNETKIEDVANEWGALFQAINAINLPGGGNPTASVVSFTQTHGNAITHVVVDSRCDIQRRRANRQAPLYVKTAVAN